MLVCNQFNKFAKHQDIKFIFQDPFDTELTELTDDLSVEINEEAFLNFLKFYND